MSETTSPITEQQQQDPGSNEMASQSTSSDNTQSEQETSKPKTALEKYCDDNPSASQCLIYEE